METDERVYAIWVSLRLGSKNNAASLLYPALGSAKRIYEADDFSGIKDLSRAVPDALKDRDLTEAERIFAECQRKNVGILSPADSLFPDRLRNIPNPPSLLYYKGNLRNLNNECVVGMVGTRAMTDYGRDVSYAFASAFIKSHAVVASGLAAGVDAMALRGALDAKGYTIAILGTPVDRIYPIENAELYEEIEEKGVILSEYYPGCVTNAGCFPARNRIIAGISCAIVVCEAGEGSGALITAHKAAMLGRPVFAVPGSTGITGTVGTNGMLDKGAIMAAHPYDVTKRLELLFPNKIKPDKRAYIYGELDLPKESAYIKPQKPKAKKKTVRKAKKKTVKVKPMVSAELEYLTAAEQAVLNAIHPENGSSADVIAAATGYTITDVLSTLTLLELYGRVRAGAGGVFVKII